MYDSTNDYVTKDLYLEFSGIDLDIELKSSQSDNPTLQVETFLRQQQKWLYTYMKSRYDEVRWETDWDDDVFTEALLWQIKHVLGYGEDNTLDATAYRTLRTTNMANRKG